MQIVAQGQKRRLEEVELAFCTSHAGLLKLMKQHFAGAHKDEEASSVGFLLIVIQRNSAEG